jgi:hypothetical protein
LEVSDPVQETGREQRKQDWIDEQLGVDDTNGTAKSEEVADAGELIAVPARVTEDHATKDPTASKFFPEGEVEHIEVTDNPEYVENKGFKGQVFLVYDYYGEGEDLKRPDEAKQKRFRRFTVGMGGDGRHFDENHIHPLTSGGLLIYNTILIGKENTRYGFFAWDNYLETPAFYRIRGGYFSRNPDGSEVRCHTRDCRFSYQKAKHRYRFTFDNTEVEVTPTELYCSDTVRHRVIVKGKKRGRLVLKQMLNFAVVQYDADGDGSEELYVLSRQGCEGWMRIFKVVV